MNRIPGVGLKQLQNYERYAKDPYAFITECCFTFDEVDAEHGHKKPFPQGEDYLYHEYCCRIWQRYKLILNPKSRRMTQSWFWLAICFWDTIFNKGRSWALVSKKEDDSGKLVKRIEFMFNHIPTDLLPRELLPVMTNGQMYKKPPRIEFDFGDGTNSTIEGFPMTADQLRQHGFSGIFGDESAFWKDAEEFYGACKPTIDGGGRMILVSSPAPGFFKRLVFDALNNEEEIWPHPAELGYRMLTPSKGIRIWINEQNQFLVLEIHYTANPRKRTKAYKDYIRRTNTKKVVRQEYELDWEVYPGKPVFEDFDPHRHTSPIAIDWEAWIPLICMLDFGHTPALVVAQYCDRQFRCLKEWTSEGTTLNKFLTLVLPELYYLFPQHYDQDAHFYWAIDPAGFQISQHEEWSCFHTMWEHGIRNVFPGPVSWEDRRKCIEDLLMLQTKDGPGFILNAHQCPKLVKGFLGGYAYPEGATDRQSRRLDPVKNEFSHPHDALQMGVYLKDQMLSGKLQPSQPPGYGGNRESKIYGLSQRERLRLIDNG